MPITVNTNMSSIIAQNSLNKATNKMNTALQRLSTGLRINSAKDDAAGSAISTKLEYKVSSYDVAKDNAQMGQSMLDTANGTLSSINSMLQRMRDLSEQAANGTYGKEEREAMQAEIDGLTAEIKRIKETTEFNGKKLFGEDVKQKVDLYPNAIRMSDSLTEAEKNDIKNGTKQVVVSTADDFVELSKMISYSNANIVLDSDIDLTDKTWNVISDFAGTFDGNGFTITSGNDRLFYSINGNSKNGTGTIKNLNLNSKAGQPLANRINGGTVENVNVNANVVDASFSGIASTIDPTDNVLLKNCYVNVNYSIGNWSDWDMGALVANCNSNNAKIQIENCHVNGTIDLNNKTRLDYNKCGLIDNVGKTTTIKDCSTSIEFINVASGVEDIVASVFGTIADGANISGVEYNDKSSVKYNVVGEDNRTTKGGITENKDIDKKYTPFDIPKPDNIRWTAEQKTNLQVGIGSDSNSVITIDTGFAVGGLSISVLEEDDARKALDTLDTFISNISQKMTDIGSAQNRLESVMEFQEVQRNALTSANSLIKDADIAEESSIYIKNQILQNVTSSLLATANQSPQIALQLI